jgi:hypothetical protein
MAQLRLLPPLIARIDKSDDILHAPEFIGNGRCHRGRNFQRLMDAAEIVEHEIERQRVATIMVAPITSAGRRSPLGPLGILIG